MVYAVVDTGSHILIRMSGALHPNEHLWTRRALGSALLRPATEVICDLGGLRDVGERECIMLAMIRRTVELRGGRVVFTAVANGIRQQLARFGLDALVAGESVGRPGPRRQP